MMRGITTEEFQKKIAEAREKNKEILQKNATCAMQGEYRCSAGGDKWIRFEGVDQGDEHFWAFDETGINDEDYHPFSHNIEFIVGQKYKYNIWGSVGQDRWEPGRQAFVWEIKENGREAEVIESIGLDVELLDVRFNDGYGKWLSIAIDELPGIMHAVPGGTCPDGGTTPPDPGPDPDPDPDPDPKPDTKPPEPCNGECPPGTKCIAAENRCEWILVERNIIPACLQFQCCQNKCEEGRPDGNTNPGCDERPTPEPVPGSNNRNQTYLYDRLNHTFVFCCPIKADVTWLLPFDTMPPVFQRYVTTTASVRVAAQMVNNPQLFQLLKDRENTLRMECMNYELEQGDLNFLNQPDHSTYMSYQTMQTLNR